MRIVLTVFHQAREKLARVASRRRKSYREAASIRSASLRKASDQPLLRLTS
jgi:hypothetical protein